MASPAVTRSKTGFPTTLLLSCVLGLFALIAHLQFETLTERFPLISQAIPGSIASYLGSRGTNPTEEQYGQEQYDHVCPKNNATIKIFSSYPLILYIENFLSEAERDHLKLIAEPLYNRSKVATDERTDDIRTSSSAMLPDEDPVADCIIRRAAEFQGYISPRRIEVLQLVRYKPGEKYEAHLDWDEGEDPADIRTSTFFAYVGCDGCSGGSTKFYSLARKAMSREWCRVINCTASGVEFLPIPGAAIFWENVDEHGNGRADVLHSGMPLLEGVKYGLNIWTRKRKMY
ncbi:Prolyl 4-hydroxylase alpha subunit [Venturia nashicola]|uniref:Prolyl 4-hydroxylase n=1 Tax=Venturia nashicola TaxID=86259 RepID=A0A4Z1PAK2_9PEZI|nr:Prolyl 4-hydroxylase [Venturia nashicola]TLD34827.1 Prolyl 4-hydroxylase alpha subunit [Venturia nashicola]